MANTLTGNSPQREREIQDRLMMDIARVIEVRLATDIDRTMKAFAREQGNRAKQNEIMAQHRDRLSTLLTRSYGEIWDAFGTRILDAALKAHHAKIETKQEPLDTLRTVQLAWIAQNVGAKVTLISNTTQEQSERIIRDATAVAVAEGLGERELARLINATMLERAPDFAAYRGQNIARTEMHSSAGAATQAAAEATGLNIVKQWSAAFQTERSRTPHLDADGDTVPLDQPFIIDGEPLMYPGDPNGSAENIINCRCVSLHVVLD
jgi:hypothetical protein